MNFTKPLILAVSVLAIMSCQKSGPQDFALGKDQCDNCRMTITEQKYATQLITQKGRAYKFDDIMCMNMYESSISLPVNFWKKLKLPSSKAAA